MAALFAMLLASCTTSPDAAFDLGMPAYTGDEAATPAVDGTNAPTSTLAQATPVPMMSAAGDTALPEKIAYLPNVKPSTAFESTAALAEAPAFDAVMPVPAAPGAEEDPAAPANSPELATATAEPTVAPLPLPRPGPDASEQPPGGDLTATGGVAPQAQVIATAADFPPLPPAEPKKKGFMATFFGSSLAAAAPLRRDTATAKPLYRQEARPIIEEQPAQPIIQVSASGRSPINLASLGDESALPGVRQTALFEIRHKSGIDDDSDVDLHEDEVDAPIQLASAAGFARLSPNGLLKQTEKVDVTCLKPSLVRVLKTIERHYGRPMIVTSGYRDVLHNRRARGAKNSLHMYCAAADVQISGVAKWDLASFVRSMPGRGGVGTYCHTDSVHVDVGPERDWNWRCRRRKHS